VDHGRRSSTKGVNFKNAHGTVPDNRLGVAEGFRKQHDGRRADVQAHPVAVHLLNRNNFVFRFGAHVFGNDAIHGQVQLDPQFPGGFHDLQRLVDQIILNDGSADLVSQRFQEREGHPAANDELIHLLNQVDQRL